MYCNIVKKKIPIINCKSMKITETIYTPFSKRCFLTCSDCILQLAEFLFRSKIAEIS